MAVSLVGTASASAVGMVAGSPACTEVVLAVDTVAVLAADTATGVEAFDYRRVTMMISDVIACI